MALRSLRLCLLDTQLKVMDKQQAAQDYANKSYGLLRDDIDRIGWHTAYRLIIDGWELCEAQKFSADTMRETLQEIAEGPGDDEIAFQFMLRAKALAQKALTNSSAAPQVGCLKVETGYKKGLQGWTAFFTIGVQTFSLGDLESEERAKWFKSMLDIAFSKLLAPTGLFTRKQVQFAFYGACNMINNILGENAIPAHVIAKLIKEYMNTNYPKIE